MVYPDDYNRFVQMLYGRHNKIGAAERVRIDGIQHPLYARPGTPDAVEIVHSVIREAYGKYLPEGDIKFVIDAGAYIGDATSWYLSKFPESRVVALEPTSESFAMLKANCSPYGERVTLIKGALWVEDGELDLLFDSTTPTGNTVAKSKSGGSDRGAAYSLNTILKGSGASEIDILKMDIEGSELQIFSENPDPWLSRTRYITMEIHSAEAHAAVHAATRRHGFIRRRYRELYIFFRK
ncbi:MAG TPA: FkbM family methyltransferase [Acidobacteriota bacterium]|nr:FkbM family methyltransferase [Acidobacteriota bacterium]